MAYNLKEGSSMADLLIRFFQSILNNPCTLALYRENIMLSSSRRTPALSKALELFKPKDNEPKLNDPGEALVIDLQTNRVVPFPSMKMESLLGKTIAIRLNSISDDQSRDELFENSEDLASQESTYLFIEVKYLTTMVKLLLHRDAFRSECGFYKKIFKKVEKNMAKKTESKYI